MFWGEEKQNAATVQQLLRQFYKRYKSSTTVDT